MVAGDQGCRLGEERFGVWRDHADPGVDLLPAEAELAPVFEARVPEAHGGEGVTGPGVHLGHVGRAGKAGADAIDEGSGELHHVRVAQAFFADASVHREVDDLGCGLRSVEGRLRIILFIGG